MKKTKSNNNELFTGIRRLTKLSQNKNLKKKSSRKSNKKNNFDKETADMLKIINSESSVENNQMYFQSKYNKNNKNILKDVDMTMVNDFVPVDDRGNIIVQNRIADLFGPIQQINSNIPQIPNNIMSEVNMDLFNNQMNTLSPNNMQQPSLDMQVQQLNNMMNMQNQMPMMNMQNQMPMMGIQNQMMGFENQLSPVNTNMVNMGSNLANIYNIPKIK
jgi:hypothetical protein